MMSQMYSKLVALSCGQLALFGMCAVLQSYHITIGFVSHAGVCVACWCLYVYAVHAWIYVVCGRNALDYVLDYGISELSSLPYFLFLQDPKILNSSLVSSILFPLITYPLFTFRCALSTSFSALFSFFYHFFCSVQSIEGISGFKIPVFQCYFWVKPRISLDNWLP